MIYDCPQCQTPQPPGVMVCRNCGVEFDGPVPEDAIMPEDVSAAPGSVTAPGETIVSEQVAEAGAATVPSADATSTSPPLEERPTVEEAVGTPTAPPLPPPVYTPPYAPAYAPIAPAFPAAAAYPAPIRQGISPVAVLVIVVLLGLLLLGGTIYAVGLLNKDTPSVAAAPPSLGKSSAAPIATGPPTTLHAGSESAQPQFDPATRWLVGRWVAAKTSDFYVFKDNGTGYRGNLSNTDQQQTFLWYIVQKQLVLYSQQQEKMPFSEGADDNTLFLRAADGRSYKTYLRTGDNG